MHNQRPWTKTPRVPLAGLSPAALADMDNSEFVELIRTNLLPAAGEREPWIQLWQHLHDDDALADKTLDCLEALLDAVEAAQNQGDLDEQEAKRAAKFKARCDEAWKRIDRAAPAELPEATSPLAWAGTAGRFGRAASQVIAELVEAITHHREQIQDPTAVDERLWRTLAELSLDPRKAGPNATGSGSR